MSLYKHLTLIQREQILIGLTNGDSFTAIAKRVGCSKSTVSREVKRNAGRNKYSAAHAQSRYQEARQKSRRRRILADSKIRNLVITLITHHQWSPEEISHRLRHEHSHIQISFNTIYRGIARDNLGIPLTSRGARGIARKLRHRGKTRKVKGTVSERRGKFNDALSIHDRPLGAINRTRFGHWEGDTVRGKTGRAALVTLVDRRSRYLLADRIPKVNAKAVTQAMIDLLQSISPNRVHTITPDRGTEFAGYREVTKVLGTTVYFPDPHAPYQRGTNENTNGLIREYFPRNTDLDLLSDIEIQAFIDKLNHRPRKVLGWKTPHEVFFGQTLHLT
ncbi:IS30 family transposase [Lacticaseibacillus saniviri]